MHGLELSDKLKTQNKTPRIALRFYDGIVSSRINSELVEGYGLFSGFILCVVLLKSSFCFYMCANGTVG